MILDTNVLSELMRGDPTRKLTNWLANHTAEDLAIAAVTVQEVVFGLTRMPHGSRREKLETTWEKLWEQLALAVRPLDGDTASLAAHLMAKREHGGNHLAVADAQIAATALAHQVPLVTRNEKDFDGLGLRVINPWN